MSPASGWMAMQIALTALQKTIRAVLDDGLYLGERGYLGEGIIVVRNNLAYT